MGNIWKWAVLSGALFFTGCGGGGSTSAPAPVKPPKYTGETCMSANALLLGGGGNALVADAADFDGTNDYMVRGGALTGAADGKSGIFSAWLRIDGSDGVLLGILNGGGRVFVVRHSLNLFNIYMVSVGGGPVLDIWTTAVNVAGSGWVHLLASWDVATAGARSIYINDVLDLSVANFNNDTVDYTLSEWSVGSYYTGINKFNGCLAEVYFAPNQYLDFSIEGNRRKFISSTGKPAHLGVDGSLPTGTAPIMYHHLDDSEAVANFATNRGTGGNFTITGTLDTATTSPSD